MDHNLDDPLNLEGDMGVDFEHTEDAVVSQADMVLEQHSVQEENMPMEFEHNEDQAMLMDTASEEIIVSDFMGDQFSLQEYSVQSDQTTGLTTTVESNQQHMLSSQGESMIDLAFQPQIVTSVKQEPVQHKIITVKTVSPIRTTAAVRKNDTTLLTTAPRQVAIAPKPPKLVAKTYTTNKQLAIAPKPVSLIANRSNSLVKKVSIANVVQSSNTKGNTVLAQIGKQIIMVPSANQKIKLVSSTGTMPVQYVRAAADPELAQIIPAKSVSGPQTKPVMTKLITVQGSSLEGEAPRYLALPHAALPLALANKVLVAAPSKQGVKLAKKQEIISLKSPTPKLVSAPALSASSTSGSKQKVVITSNPMQNVILKQSATSKTGHAAKDANVVESQRSQLHQINVPGKGIQYFRVVTNSSKPAPKPLLALPSKTFMLSDGKGNLIQMSAEKITPSLVMSGNKSTLPKVAPKPTRKLVRIAPVATKTSQAVTQAARSSQSLLAPLSPASPASPTSPASPASPSAPASASPDLSQETDSKTALRALIEKAVAEGNIDEVEVEYNRKTSLSLENSTDIIDQQDSSGRSDEHPLIVIPSNYDQSSEILVPEAMNSLDESKRSESMINIEGESLNAYQSPGTPALSDTDIAVATDLGLRPRKACNCTKSQCLKLYCDCFANGEFCNRCNCNNCHNNLENEELRQKAIRGCLDRNPNAFRPKIGKAKIGGPDIIRRHNKGCNCKRSGCLKNYCECYEAKIACTSICKCVGCRNVEETLERARRRDHSRAPPAAHYRPPPAASDKQPCNFMTTEVIEAVCQCLLAAAAGEAAGAEGAAGEAREADALRDVIDEFARCLQDIISAAHHSAPLAFADEGPA